MTSRVLELVECPDPECTLPAEVVDRVKVCGRDTLATVCVDGHRFCGVPG